MKRILALIILILSSASSFSQEKENLSSEEQQLIVKDIKRCTESLEFLQSSMEYISLMSLSFNSERLSYNDSPWCNNYLAVMSSIIENSDDLKKCNISWESREITPDNNCQSKVCGVFCYKIITEMGCVYCGRNYLDANLVKNEDGNWVVDNINDLSLLALTEKAL